MDYGAATLEPKERARLLARASTLLLPSPFEDADQFKRASAEIVAVLDELAGQYRLNWREDPHDRSRLLAILSEEMADAATVASDKKDSRARLGQRGDLLPESYDVTFSDLYTRVAKKTGVSKGQVRAAILHADDAQHLLPEQSDAGEGNAFSIFISFESGPRIEPFCWIVMGRRRGYVIHVEAAFRLFVSDFDFSGVHKPIDLLRAFVEIYGIPISIGKTETLFATYELVHGEDGKDQIDLVSFSPSKKTDGILFGIMKNLPGENAVEVGIAFAIDLTLYKEALRQRKIRVR